MARAWRLTCLLLLLSAAAQELLYEEEEAQPYESGGATSSSAPAQAAAGEGVLLQAGEALLASLEHGALESAARDACVSRCAAAPLRR